ncbi:MAG: GtrA family protein [Clostridia bacterium]|nr:GtrA family protein [Clostridia bacterium]
MKAFLMKLKRTFFSLGFLEYCAIGFLNTFNSALFSSIGSLILQENLAAVFGYLCSITIAFVLNCLLIFKKKPTIRRYLRFALSYVPNFIIYFIVTFITLNTLGLPQFWGTVLAAVTGGPITFIIIKLYTFKQRLE